jgi:hypothetical protein
MLARADASVLASQAQEDDAPLTGWNGVTPADGSSSTGIEPGVYSFAYLPTVPADSNATVVADGASPAHLLLVKAVAAGNQLLVSFMQQPCPTGQQVTTLDFDLARFCGPDASGYTYSNLAELAESVERAVAVQLQPAGGQGKVAASTGGDTRGSSAAAALQSGKSGGVAQTSGAGSGSSQAPLGNVEGGGGEHDPLRLPSRRSQQIGRPGPVDPYSVGSDDLMPGELAGRLAFIERYSCMLVGNWHGRLLCGLLSESGSCSTGVQLGLSQGPFECCANCCVPRWAPPPRVWWDGWRHPDGPWWR